MDAGADIVPRQNFCGLPLLYRTICEIGTIVRLSIVRAPIAEIDKLNIPLKMLAEMSIQSRSAALAEMEKDIEGDRFQFLYIVRSNLLNKAKLEYAHKSRP